MKPLTIDELKALEVGDWVWVKHKDYNDGYLKKVSYNDSQFEFSWFAYSDYGTKWLAYKNKEQTEGKGEWLKLPCKVGDDIYVICYNGITKQHYISPKKITQTEFKYVNGKLIDGRVYTLDPYDKLDTVYVMRKFGIRWFTDKSEAEARLKELRGEK